MNTEPRTSGTSSYRHIDNDTGPFLCKICSKAFTKRTSRNRHVLYCRKKLVDSLPVLRKSCAACRKAKAKCDSELPNCSRCDDRGLTCVYELTRKSATSAQQPEPSSDSTLLVDIAEPGNQTDIRWNAHADNGNDDQISLDMDTPSLWLAPVPDLTPQNDLALWESEAGFVEDLEVSDMGANISSNGYPFNGSPINWFISSPSPSLGLTLDATFSTPADCMFHTPYLVLRPMDYDLSPTSPRSPFIHAYLSTGSQIGRTFLLQNFKSYATALATKNLPPFIHGTSLPPPNSCQTPTCATPPPLPTLEICKSIVSLYTTKTPATSSFIWRTITMEKNRFINEYVNGDEWTVLSMLQAVTLYILLRIFDEDSFSAEFDSELARAMTEIEIQAGQFKLVCSAEIEGRRPEWKEWVLVESKRRTVTVLFILHLLFDIKPEGRAKSKVGLSVLPLPAHKNLWEAATEGEWIEKYDEMLRARDGRGHLRWADLMALGRGHGGDKMNDLSSWMVSGDAFGMLVLMAANSL
ncbi:hypothetical protein BU16DRAFT_489440 [Lophium mytilinum]|uniref:Zn(2)-C6 fungal-type domain-containing protein n=1 Tax=Lophium mytilinum TaxID=390894 RepID=A0A6A6QQ85_9PEZI|nr:hypothetical protein BU16DRAFT_489440 [Lophium mytilinum]